MITQFLIRFFKSHAQRITIIGIGLMSIAAVVWLTYEIWRFMWNPRQLKGIRIHPGAIDLIQRYQEVQAWFGGNRVYNVIGTAVYPPASYVMLWPLIGWVSFTTAKFIWLFTSLAAVAVLSCQMVTHSLARTRLERLFIALIPFSVYATGAAIGNGQLIVYVLPLVLFGVIWTCKDGAPRVRAWLGSLSILFALVQPTIAAPFFWLVMFVPNKIKHAAFIVSGYLLLTLFAVFFQLAPVSGISVSGPSTAVVENQSEPAMGGVQQGATVLVENWSGRAMQGVQRGSTSGGYANVHTLLAEFGLGRWNLHASFLILIAFGFWVFFNRKADIWLLIGVTAIIARFWMYHRWYNDLLLLLPLISLYRLIRYNESSEIAKRIAITLFALNLALSIAPGGLYLLPFPLNSIYVYVQVTVWVAMFLFLMIQVHQSRHWARARPTDPPPALSALSREVNGC